MELHDNLVDAGEAVSPIPFAPPATMLPAIHLDIMNWLKPV